MLLKLQRHVTLHELFRVHAELGAKHAGCDVESMLQAVAECVEPCKRCVSTISVVCLSIAYQFYDCAKNVINKLNLRSIYRLDWVCRNTSGNYVLNIGFY